VPTVEEEVRELDGHRFDVLLRQDFDELERILADDLTYTHSIGWLENKDEYLATVRSRLVYRAIEATEDVKARVYGDTAVTTGRATMKVGSADEPTSLDVRYTSVYVKRDGRWQMVAWHATRLSDQ